jgi:ankyrin repeat protein
MQGKPDEATINRAKQFLYKAVAEDRLDNIKKILSAQFPIETEVGPGGQTLLMHCAQFGSVECLDILMSFGANINTTDNNGRTALHYACASGR